MDATERALFDRSLRRAVASPGAGGLEGALSALGWHEALADDTRWTVGRLFEHQGTAATTSAALDDVLGLALGLEPTPVPPVLLPALGGADPPGSLAADGRMAVAGVAGVRMAGAGSVVVVCGGHGATAVATVDAAALTRRPVLGMDPALGLVEVTGQAVAAASPLAPGRWHDALRLGRLALGHELVGASAAMVELARAHALERVQFGRPVGMFQAVRHRLADAVVAVESARALLETAWEDAGAESAAMAKALAGRSARTAARHAQQVLAGMGFTTEHPLARYVRRVLVLDELLGSARSLTLQLGRDVLARRRLPAPLAL